MNSRHWKVVENYWESMNSRHSNVVENYWEITVIAGVEMTTILAKLSVASTQPPDDQHHESSLYIDIYILFELLLKLE